jgi:hypothetical protein
MQNWQQAGILLLEDTSFTGKSMRVSFVYNNFLWRLHSKAGDHHTGNNFSRKRQ